MFEAPIGIILLTLILALPVIFLFICYLSSICLRISALWLNFKETESFFAFKSVGMSYLVNIAINVFIGTQYSLHLFQVFMAKENGMKGFEKTFLLDRLMVVYSPYYFLWSLIFGLACTAFIFHRTLYPEHIKKETTFYDSMALAVVHFGVFYTVLFSLLAVAYLFVIIALKAYSEIA